MPHTHTHTHKKQGSSGQRIIRLCVWQPCSPTPQSSLWLPTVGDLTSAQGIHHRTSTSWHPLPALYPLTQRRGLVLYSTVAGIFSLSATSRAIPLQTKEARGMCMGVLGWHELPHSWPRPRRSCAEGQELRGPSQPPPAPFLHTCAHQVSAPSPLSTPSLPVSADHTSLHCPPNFFLCTHEACG